MGHLITLPNTKFPFMKKLLPAILALTTIAFAMPACKKSASVMPADITKPITLPSNGSVVVEASNRFAFNFFKAALKNDASLTTNKLISPLSIYMALSMVYNGADNATKDSMAAALQLQGIDIANLNAVCKALIEQLPGEDNLVKLSIANSIWYRQGNIQPLQSFLDINSNYFNASVKGLDFNNPASVDVINKWVSDNTQGKIPTIISQITPDDLMYLINAVYFKGAWQNTFKAQDTYNSTFNLQGGGTVTVPFMKQQFNTNIYYSNQLRLIELPYGGGGSYSMYIADAPDLLQTPSTNINMFAASLDASGLKTLIAGMHKTNVTLAMPKWEFAYNIDDFTPELRALGMGIALGDGADFSKMYNTTVAITKALHKTYIKVDEEGTTAAAATSIGVGVTAIDLGNYYYLDHPFVFIIAEKQTGAILFTGVLNDPSK